MIRAGQTSTRLIGTTDVLATIADLIGARLPRDAAEDSVSFAGNLRNPARALVRSEGLVLHSQNGSFAIRKGGWKLMLTHAAGTDDDPPADAASPRAPSKQLYDLDRDPQEASNTVAEHPDVVRTLERLLKTYQQRGRSRN